MTFTRRGVFVAAGGVLGAYFAHRRAETAKIPFLITADVHDQPDLYEHLSGCMERAAALNMKLSIFIPAVLTRRAGVTSILRRMLSEGHDVGCHGLTHSEDYYTDSRQTQRHNLISAKQIIEDATGTAIGAFRAPAFRISNDTLTILDEVGFTADLSICSQRLPLISSQIGNYHWLFSPRVPYHPSKTNPYAKGDLRILEIPLSAVALPLMSALSAVSEATSEFITAVLRYEAAFISKPIVYQCHIEDFVLVDQHQPPMSFSWRSLVPTKYGIPLRWAFETTDGKVLYNRNQEFLSFLKQIEPFEYVSVADYLRQHKLMGN